MFVFHDVVTLSHVLKSYNLPKQVVTFTAPKIIPRNRRSKSYEQIVPKSSHESLH